jgi:hypothetical protein
VGDYLNYQRNVLNTPHPIYGNCVGFSVGDLPKTYEVGLTVFNAITANTTSPAIDVAANAIELGATFSDLHTSCSITVYLADGVTQIANFDNVSTLNSSGLYVGFFDQRVIIGGGKLVFKASNWSGSGTLTLLVRRTG